MNSTNLVIKPGGETFSWQSFSQTLALYIAMGILALLARKFGLKLHTAHNGLHEKINQLDLKISSSVNG